MTISSQVTPQRRTALQEFESLLDRWRRVPLQPPIDETEQLRWISELSAIRSLAQARQTAARLPRKLVLAYAHLVAQVQMRACALTEQEPPPHESIG